MSEVTMEMHTALAATATKADAFLLQTALQHLPLGLCMFDADDRLLLANARYLSIWGLPTDMGRPGTSFADIMAATPGQETSDSRAATPTAHGAGTRVREWSMHDGRSIRVAVTRLPDGCSVALHEDITEQRQAQARVAFLARHDLLTGLPNRTVLCEALQEVGAAGADGKEAALLYLDLDRFKEVNDRYGHAGGDELLQKVAERLRDIVRADDLVARLSGDEFAVLQRAAAQPASAKALATRLIEGLGTVFELEGGRAHIGVSVGIAIAPFDGSGPEELLKNADLALYQAKSDGRGTQRFFEPGMDARVAANQALEGDLRRALAEHQFELAYQVQVDTVHGTVCGVEALLRWNHPHLGRVSPDRFIPMAEQSGLIVPIGRWVLECACRDAMRWPAHVQVAVNVSAVQFRHDSLLRDVSHALHCSGLPAQRLEIEITESVMMQTPDQALRLLRELRKHGVRVAMDDFGTGYSSLATLRSFPFDRLKIDRSFVRDIDTNPDAQAIVRAVVGLGRSLGMSTTVEGVETASQLKAAQREGCSEVQGYLFSRPGPADAVPALIERLTTHRAWQAQPDEADDTWSSN